ncbi:MAG: hypothetical protein ACE361_22320 [Aureliella sp.]
MGTAKTKMLYTLAVAKLRDSSISIDVKPVRTARDRAAFVRLPWTIYVGDPKWVPPIISDQKSVLDPDKGPFFEHGKAELFLAYQNGQPVGRITAHVNERYDEIYGSNKGFIGFFECIDDKAVASALFDRAAGFLREQGKSIMEGPYSFSIYDEIGIQLDGFDNEPYVLTAHTRPYYRSLFEGNGFAKSIDWYAFRVDASKPNSEMHRRYDRIRSRVEKLGRLELRQMDRGKNFSRDADIVKKIFSDAWEKNWGHVPMSDSEFQRVAEFIRLIVCPELSLIAEVDGEPVGCSLVIYDANQVLKKLNGRILPFGWLRLLTGVRKSNRARLILMGMMEEYRNHGYDLGFYLHISDQTTKAGLEELEMSLVVENNHALLNTLEKLPGVERYKTFRIYQRELQ